MLMFKAGAIAVLLLSLVLPVFVPRLAAAQDAGSPLLVPGVIITEVKIQFLDAKDSEGQPTDYNEFVELYNPTTIPVALDDFALEYRSASTVYTESKKPPVQNLPAGILGPGQYLLLIRDVTKGGKQVPNSEVLSLSANGLSDSGGQITLLYQGQQLADEVVTWGKLTDSTKTKSFSRPLAMDGSYVLFDPVWPTIPAGTPTPQSSTLMFSPSTPDEEDEQDTPDPINNDPPAASVTCEGIILNEVLPNPAGADAGKEFIELYNPTNEVIGLKGCSLQTSANSKKYALPDIAVDPGAYVVFTDAVTGLSLPNSAGGKVWLLSPTDELSVTVYPGGLEDDASWSLIDGTWQMSYLPTPAVANVAMVSKPCPAGQSRSTETNRCVASVVTAVATLTPCKAGQERNPETNRCRTIAATTSSLVPCKAGQERNPETNRCRAIASTASSALKPCAEGQERNPDTNRCRKVSSGATLGAVTDVESVQQSGGGAKWWLAGAAVAVAVGYGAYEWRRDVWAYAQKLKPSFGRKG